MGTFVQEVTKVTKFPYHFWQSQLHVVPLADGHIQNYYPACFTTSGSPVSHGLWHV